MAYLGLKRAKFVQNHTNKLPNCYRHIQLSSLNYFVAKNESSILFKTYGINIVKHYQMPRILCFTIYRINTGTSPNRSSLETQSTC
jgi:hypothetical protein